MNCNVDVEVIVVGAGAAGLAAARLLAESGKTVRILEARDRIGGRIFTQHVTLAEGELAVELGAEFIHGLPAVSWDMVREAALATYELDGEMFCFEHGRLRPCEPQQHDSFALLRQMADWLQCHTPPADLSFDDYVQAARIDSGSAARAARYVEGFNAADRRIISATALVRQQQAEDAMEGDRIFHIRRGYDALPHYLAQRVQHAGGHFALRSWVEQISWRPGAVTVRGRCEGHDFLMRAEQAVIALPLGVLQSEGIRFDPAPAQAVRSWQSLAMGDVNRISLVFDRPFWIERARNLSFLFAPEEIFPTWWTSAPETAPTIVGWAGGAINFARSQIAVARGRTELRSAALQSLARIFDIPVGDLSAWLRGVHHHDWHADPYARGAYSYVPAGAVAAARQLSQPLEDTLYFAGEHTDLADQWGTVHGALASGIRAARHVLKIP